MDRMLFSKKVAACYFFKEGDRMLFFQAAAVG
jgi:hypothetical protein